MSALDELGVFLEPIEETAEHPVVGVCAGRVKSSIYEPAVGLGWTIYVGKHTPEAGDLVLIGLRSGATLIRRVVRVDHKNLATSSPVTGGSARSFSLGSVTARAVVALLAPAPGWSAVDEGPTS